MSDSRLDSAPPFAAGELGPIALVSVVMAARNAEPVIAHQIRALLRQDYGGPWELLIVDNGSTDATATECAAALSGARPTSLVQTGLLSLDSPRGYATPRNYAIARAKGDLIAVCDADDVVAEGWLASLVAASERAPFLASRQLPYGPIEVDTSGTLPKKFGVELAHTGGSAFRRALFDALGGFDPAFDCGGEDIDFALRALLHLGIRPVLVPDALYFVRARQSVRGAFRQGYRNGRSQVRLYCRHAGAAGIGPSPLTIVPRRLYRLMRLVPHLARSQHRRDWFVMAGVYTGRFVWSVRRRAAWF